MLFVGKSTPESAFSIALPLHPIDLERELNRVSSGIEQRRAAPGVSIKMRGEAANA